MARMARRGSACAHSVSPRHSTNPSRSVVNETLAVECTPPPSTRGIALRGDVVARAIVSDDLQAQMEPRLSVAEAGAPAAADTVRVNSDGPMQQAALHAAMQRFGAVSDVKIMRKKRNFALVTFVDEASAATAAGVSGSTPAALGGGCSTAAAALATGGWPVDNALIYRQDGGGSVTLRIARTWPIEGEPLVTAELARDLLREVLVAAERGPGWAPPDGTAGIRGPWAALREAATVRMGRPLFKMERPALTDALNTRFDVTGTGGNGGDVASGNKALPRLLLLSAFTTDYSVGHVCTTRNRAYAERHGYAWRCDVLQPATMAATIAPRKFGGWYKVNLLRELLLEQQQQSTADGQYDAFVWIDADAVVVEPSLRRFEDLLAAHPTSDLIIGEDVTRASLVSTGVMVVRATAWSLHLFDQLWEGSWARAYHHVRQYEQSALQRGLAILGEHLEPEKGTPFHSFAGGAEIKETAHCAVVSRRTMNSNIGEEAEFVFHAVARIGRKEELVLAELQRRGMLGESELEPMPAPRP